jgi:hypothetical protein
MLMNVAYLEYENKNSNLSIINVKPMLCPFTNTYY